MATKLVKLKVFYVDGTDQEVLAGPRAQVELERHFGMSIEEAKRIEHVYYLAWAAMKFALKEHREFDEFLEAITDVENLGDLDANPTPESPLSES